MDFIKSLERDKNERNGCYNIIDKYLNKCNRPRQLEHIAKFLDIELSCHGRFYIGHNKKAKRIYDDKKYFTQFTIHLYFPKANIKIIMSKEYAEELYYTAQLSIGVFADKKITFQYYDKELKYICNGPQIIISMIEPCAIICNNNKNLDEMIIDSPPY